MDFEDIDIFLGLDVGKSSHWACALTREGKQVWSKALPNREEYLVALFQELMEHGNVLLVVDQPANIGALSVSVAKSLGMMTAYLPGLAMRRAADLYPGDAKNDKRDAYIIADMARTMSHSLYGLPDDEEIMVRLKTLSGFDEDLTGEATRLINKIRGLYTQIHPPLEGVVGKWLTHVEVLELIAKWPTAADLRRAGLKRVDSFLKTHGARPHHSWATKIMAALGQQSVVVAGTSGVGTVLSMLAQQLCIVQKQRSEIVSQLEEILQESPLYQVLNSMPGVSLRTAAVVISETSGRYFRNANAFASYCGLTPRTRQSGTSIRSAMGSKGGNKRLKRALYLSAFASIQHPDSRAYYDRKRKEGKNHAQALIALAHKRATVMYAMMRDGALYEPQNTQLAA